MTTTEPPTSTTARPTRSALYQLNGGGGVIDAARRLAGQEIDQTLVDLIRVVRQEERRRFADELVTKIAEQTTRLGHIDKTEAIGMINRMARQEVAA